MTDPRERMTPTAIERELVLAGVPKEKAHAQAALEAARDVGDGRRAVASPRAVLEQLQREVIRQLVQERPVLAPHSRFGDTLRLVLNLAPRTKKNGGKGGFGGIRQRPAYRRYRDAIIAALAPLRSQLRLPLPEREYNIAATYYVDRGGEQADKCGLDQGLYDALENAGVVTDDWQFRTDDGTRIVAGDPHPRVELTITPIREEQDAQQ